MIAEVPRRVVMIAGASRRVVTTAAAPHHVVTTAATSDLVAAGTSPAPVPVSEAPGIAEASAARPTIGAVTGIAGDMRPARAIGPAGVLGGLTLGAVATGQVPVAARTVVGTGTGVVVTGMNSPAGVGVSTAAIPVSTSVAAAVAIVKRAVMTGILIPARGSGRVAGTGRPVPRVPDGAAAIVMTAKGSFRVGIGGAAMSLAAPEESRVAGGPAGRGSRSRAAIRCGPWRGMCCGRCGSGMRMRISCYRGCCGSDGSVGGMRRWPPS